MDFVAIDFETANSNRSSACSLGIAVVRDGQIVNTIYELIKPFPFYFDHINTSIHGITEEDVINKPTFETLYNQRINEVFRNNVVISHNAAFDMSVLRHSMGESLQSLNHEINYACSLVISKTLLAESENHKLPTLCRNFGINLENHHNALDDAIACAKLTMCLANFQKSESIESLIEHLDCQIGNITNKGYLPFSSSYSRFSSSNISKTTRSSSIVQFDWINLDDFTEIGTELFEGKTIVYSGVFRSFERADLKKLLDTCGAKVTSSISAKTDYLVAGENMGPAKLEKATKLGINIISEQEFINMINS